MRSIPFLLPLSSPRADREGRGGAVGWLQKSGAGLGPARCLSVLSVWVWQKYYFSLYTDRWSTETESWDVIVRHYLTYLRWLDAENFVDDIPCLLRLGAHFYIRSPILKHNPYGPP